MSHRFLALQTPVGQIDKRSRWRATAGGITAAAVVAADFWLVWNGRYALIGERAVVPALAVLVYALLYRGDLSAMGLRLRPVQGLRYWVNATAMIGAAIGAFILLALAVALLTRSPIPIYQVHPGDVWSRFEDMCIISPIFEALHVLYGNPGSDNLIAGFFLAWAYLKSGTIVVPVTLHLLGNLCALALHLGTWY
jgi:membrane protease YdiL (CAAX protease family)